MICALSCSYIGTFCMFFDRIDPGPNNIMKKIRKVKPREREKRVLIRSGIGSDFITVVVYCPQNHFHSNCQASP